jgi:hypothetical protein
MSHLTPPAGAAPAGASAAASPSAASAAAGGKDAKHDAKEPNPAPAFTREELAGKVLLFACPAMESLANEICEYSRGRIVRGHIQWLRFPDSFPNLFIQNAKQLKWAVRSHACRRALSRRQTSLTSRHVMSSCFLCVCVCCCVSPVLQDCAFLASFHSPDVIFEQLSMIYSLPRYFAKSLTVLLPYFVTGTMERVSVFGEVATANSLARMLSLTPPCKSGPPTVVVFDIHTLQNQFYFSDQVLIRLKSCVHLLVKTIARLPDAKAVSV